jgi:uncharacterized repeat protein (TIGR01451 family)
MSRFTISILKKPFCLSRFGVCLLAGLLLFLGLAQVSWAKTYNPPTKRASVAHTVSVAGTGSIGNLVWKDTNNDGIYQPASESGVAGVRFVLYVIDQTSVIPSQTAVSGTTGQYSFTGLESGLYVVLVEKASLPTSCSISSKPLSGTDRTTDSDFDAPSGEAPPIIIDTTQPESSTAHNNLTIDLALVNKACVVPPVPTVSSSGSAVCASAPVTLTATCSSGTPRWSTNETTSQITVYPVGPSTYTVVCQEFAGCTSAPATVSATGAPLPNAGPDQTLTCVGGVVSSSTTLTARSNTNTNLGQWYAQASNPNATTFASATSLTTAVSGLQPGGTYYFVWANNTGCSDEVFITVQSCGTPALLTIKKTVSKTRAQVGDVLTYTVVLANTGGSTANNVVVVNTLSEEAVGLPNSASVSVGTVTAGSPAQWTVASLPANATATLTFSASVVSGGVVYCTATVSNSATAQVCTSVPIKVCKGSQQGFELMAPAGYTTYIWYKNGTVQPVGTQGFTAVGAGEYSVEVSNGQSGSCLNGSCCPVVIEEEDALASASLTVGLPTCLGNVPQANATLTVTGLGSNANQYTYQYSTGAAFNGQQPIPAQPISITTTVPTISMLAGGADYTVRITAPGGCYRDIVVRINNANCSCPPTLCIPATIRKIRSRGVAIGR